MNWTYKIAIMAVILSAAALTFSSLKDEGLDQDESGSRKHTEAYEKAFNEHDADKLAALWAPDAIYVNLTTHDTLQGRDEINDFFKDEFENESGSNLKIAIESVKFKDSHNILERGLAITNSKNQGEKKSAFLAELKNINGSWLLQKVYEVDIEHPFSNYEHLKELEWLVGKWGLKNEYLNLSSEISWAENKNFLIQKLSIDLLDQKVFDGQQIIGWDPNKKQIRSWMIDYDGEFGEGFWSKDDNHWYVSMSFTLPDGRKASATHIFTQINSNSYTFASEDRDIDGKLLPNIKPLTINKLQ